MEDGRKGSVLTNKLDVPSSTRQALGTAPGPGSQLKHPCRLSRCLRLTRSRCRRCCRCGRACACLLSCAAFCSSPCCRFCAWTSSPSCGYKEHARRGWVAATKQQSVCCCTAGRQAGVHTEAAKPAVHSSQAHLLRFSFFSFRSFLRARRASSTRLLSASSTVAAAAAAAPPTAGGAAAAAPGAPLSLANPKVASSWPCCCPCCPCCPCCAAGSAPCCAG